MIVFLLKYFIKGKIWNKKKAYHDLNYNLDSACKKEHPDLYEDDDFIKILKMDSEEIRTEVYSQKQDPDEVLAIIRAELGKKVIPIEKNKNYNYPIDASSLLFNIANKKILKESFSVKKTNTVSLSKITVSPAIIITFTILFFIPIKELFPIIPIGNNDKNTNTYVNPFPTRQNNIALINKKPLNLPLINNNEISPVFTANMNIILKEENNNFEKININKNPIRITSRDGAKSLVTLAMLTAKKNRPDKIILPIESGDNLYRLTKEYNFPIKSWKVLEGLPNLVEGNTLELTMGDKYIEKVAYVKNDGLVYSCSLDTNCNTNTYHEKRYSIEDRTLRGKVLISLAKSIRNNKQLKNNALMADRITYKIKNYSKQNNPNNDINNISSDLFYTIKLKVRIKKQGNNEDNEIIGIEKIENFIIASK